MLGVVPETHFYKTLKYDLSNILSYERWRRTARVPMEPLAWRLFKPSNLENDIKKRSIRAGFDIQEGENSGSGDALCMLEAMRNPQAPQIDIILKEVTTFIERIAPIASIY